MSNKLKMLVLKHLKQQPRAGYGLIKDIHEATGWKPSYGSLYPLLEQLRKDDFVTFKEEGKKKVYSLTKAGLQAEKELVNQHSEMVAKVRENHKLILHLFNMKDDPLSEAMFRSLEQGKVPLSEFTKESMEMKKELFRLYQENKIKKHEKGIKNILDNATRELRRMQ